MENGNFVTETNKAPLVQILTLFFLSSAIICTLCRLYTKLVVITIVSMDDYFVPISTLFLVGQSVAVTVMTANGYGKPSTELSSTQMSTILKAQYSATLLYIPGLLFSKLPTLVILNVVSPLERFRKLLFLTALVILAWAGSSEIVSAFQCRPLLTWNFVDGQCLDRVAFYTYFEVMNAVTDLLLVLLPIALVANIKTSISRRLSVLSVFCVRSMSVGAIIAKLILLMSETNDDPFSATWPVTICTQLIQFLSLLSACLLYLRPFLEALTPGFINGDDLRRRGQIKPYLMDSGHISDELTSAMSRSIGHTDSSGTQLETSTYNSPRTKPATNTITSMASSQDFKPALLVVDMQEDFCPPKGSLAVKGGRDLAQGINRLLTLPFALKVATRDWHPKDHASFATNHAGPNNKPFEHKTTMTNPTNSAETKESMLWPVHCVQDTPGAELIPELHVNKLDLIVSKGLDSRVEMYSAFNNIFGNQSGASVDIRAFFEQRRITHVYVCGLTGDVCVFENAMGARKAGFEVVVLQDLTRAVDQEAGRSTVEQMERVGIVVTESTGKDVSRVEGLA